MATKTPKKFRTVIKPDGAIVSDKPLPKTPKPNKRDGWLATIQEANFRMEEGHRSVTANYGGTPIVRGGYEPHALAKALSQKFEHMRFVVVYDRGEHSIVAEPVTMQWPTEGQDYELERAARDAERYVGETVRTYWPNFSVVKAWADGYAAAPTNRDRVRELERENERLRAYGSMMPMWGHPFGR